MDHNSEIYINENLGGRVIGEIDNTYARVSMYDCHGTEKFRVENVESIFKSVNDFEKEAWAIMYPNRTKLAYITGIELDKDNLEVKDANRNIIANIQKDENNLPNNLKITIYNLNHQAADPILLSLLSAKISFLNVFI